MTLETCKRLLKQYEDINDVLNAKIMREKIAHKLTLPKYKHLAEVKEEVKDEVKSGKKSKG